MAWIDDRLRRFGGAILADEPGLGKSWVAATVASRRMASGGEVEIIVPASLRPTWSEVVAAFGLAYAAVLTHETVRRNPPATAAGLVVVDEAHRFRNPSTKGWNRLARRIAGRDALFLTATPIWNSPADLLALLRLLFSDDALRCSGVASIEIGLPDPVLRARILERLVLRRDSSVIPAHMAMGPVRRRTITYEVPSSWVGITKELESLRFPHCLGYSNSLLTQLMIRRLHSSPAALRATLARQSRFCRTGLDLLRDGYRLNRREFTRFLVVEECVQELLFPQLFLEAEDEPDADELLAEIERIDSLLAKVSDLGSEKRRLLFDELERAGSPSLIFVTSVDTADELFSHLSAVSRCGVATGRHCRSRSGGRSIGALTADFQSGRLDHLILTDLGGEGLNLQRADRVIHYDLPWSPMRIEQRNGRAWRIGREGRPLEIIRFQPRDGDLPNLSVIGRKQRESDSFWSITDQEIATEPSLIRLPSRIVTGHPQVDLWEQRGGSAHTGLLLRRYPAGIELMMRDADSAESLERLMRRLRSGSEPS